MKTNVKMPEVLHCAQSACAYNRKAKCHARAITVGGGGSEHLCDTLFVSGQHTLRDDTAGVGACRASNCVYNADRECVADGGVTIEAVSGQAECLTFKAQE
jgi:hypothetical protein